MPKNFYPLFIISLLGAFLLFSSWAAYRASTRGSQVTDRDYYSKGLKYNSTQVEKRAASVLGWKVATTLNNRQLQIDLSDGNGTPVKGATGKLIFFQQAEVATNNLLLTQSQPGTYQTQLPNSLQGEVAVRVEFELQGSRLNRQLLLNLR